ncbi:unnamed protein product [Medioppia subpectinata]|uniref:Uncharacterized protein n=1 Tax=Medioppia subpectinata TaxID=1979941 RepID=A0A7R9Q7L8_9ACAR|nr:unnamed protein product [Medioppia subpectinata]CAG2115878.1 unnamed protein product [Medioppia subpectinata]
MVLPQFKGNIRKRSYQTFLGPIDLTSDNKHTINEKFIRVPGIDSLANGFSLLTPSKYKGLIWTTISDANETTNGIYKCNIEYKTNKTVAYMASDVLKIAAEK